MSRSQRLPLGLAALVLSTATACMVDETDELEVAADSPGTVERAVRNSCSSDVVAGLSLQIVAEIQCDRPSYLVEVPPSDRLVYDEPSLIPYLAEGAAQSLATIVGSTTRILKLVSAFRSLPQQYLIYRWHQLRRCNIPAAAPPGQGNHESGRAIDISNYAEFRSVMTANGWVSDVPGDRWHFIHKASADLDGIGVAAFQRLWNRNNPHDPLPTDGVANDSTIQRLRKAPAAGFELGASCR